MVLKIMQTDFQKMWNHEIYIMRFLHNKMAGSIVRHE